MNNSLRISRTLVIVCVLLLNIAVVVSQSSAQPPKYFFKVTIMAADIRVSDAEVLQSELRKIGIDSDVVAVEYGALEDLIHGNKKPYAEGGWDIVIRGEDVWTDPSRLRYDYLSTSSENYFNWYNAESDRLLQEAASTFDLSTRKQLYSQWEKLYLTELPKIMLYQIGAFYQFRKEVSGIDEYWMKWRHLVSDPPWVLQNMTVSGTDTMVFAEYFWYPNLLPVWFNYLSGTYLTLVRLGPGYIPVPELAESWTLADDQLTWTFHIQKNAKWSDGYPVTSRDVKFTYESHMNPKLGSGFQAELESTIASMETPDDKTLIIKTIAPAPGLLNLLSSFAGLEILPEHVLGKVPVEDWKTSNYNTKTGVPASGPWKIKELTETYLKYEANPLYFRGPPKMKYLVYERIKDASTALAALEKGEVHILDFWYRLGAQYEQMKNEGKFELRIGPRLDADMIACNENNPDLKKAEVRQAISYAFPRESYVTDVLFGIAHAQNLPLPFDHWAYDHSIPETPYSIDLAKAAMEKAGYSYAVAPTTTATTAATTVAPPTEVAPSGPGYEYYAAALIIIVVIAAVAVLALRRRKRT